MTENRVEKGIDSSLISEPVLRMIEEFNETLEKTADVLQKALDESSKETDPLKRVTILHEALIGKQEVVKEQKVETQ